LWFTVLFANFAEAVAEGRGKAQADTLRKARTETRAKRIQSPATFNRFETVAADKLRAGDLVVCEAGDIIPGDGDVIEGIASVNEAAITGESAPVIRESGGDRSAVTGGTTVISDRIIIRITSSPGSSFLDRMIKLVEGAERQKTPNEIALDILLVGLTIIFVFATATIPSYVTYAGGAVSVVILVALFVTLIPTTIGALLSAIGIAGMDRLVRFNVLAMSGRRSRPPATSTRCCSTRREPLLSAIARQRKFSSFQASPSGRRLKPLCSPATRTRRRRGVPSSRWCRTSTMCAGRRRPVTRGSSRFQRDASLGVDIGQRKLRKGAIDSVLEFARQAGGKNVAEPQAFRAAVDKIARSGGTPLGLVENDRILGVIHLKDVVKPDVKDRFAAMRRMGIKTVMITGDNPVTAAAIASEGRRRRFHRPGDARR
jgi:K+-transporting ATPase ATPase B chain